jgi:hypothetical protein
MAGAGEVWQAGEMREGQAGGGARAVELVGALPTRNSALTRHMRAQIEKVGNDSLDGGVRRTRSRRMSVWCAVPRRRRAPTAALKFNG